MTTQTNTVNAAPLTLRAELTTEFYSTLTDAVRLFTATSVLTARLSSLTMRAATITVETASVGVGSALDYMPETYEETKSLISDLFADDDEDDTHEPQADKPRFGEK